MTLSELESATPSSKKSKKAKLTKPDGAAAKSSKKEEEDWEDDEHDSASMYKEIDAQGPWEKSMAGTLEKTAMIKLRKIIGKYAYKSFMDVKEELMQKRLRLF